MARYRGPRCKLSRREGMDLLLTSRVRDIEGKCKFAKTPGAVLGKRVQVTDYGVQLREKQKLRRMYGVLERQFLNYYKRAATTRGSSGDVLLRFLETRLDNVVYRMGFAVTRSQARQLVSHRCVEVNGVCVNIPSYAVDKGETISIRSKAKKQLKIREALSSNEEIGFVGWVEVDIGKMEGVFKDYPDRSEILQDINESLVIEYYSK